MFALVCVSILASTLAAPQYYHHHHDHDHQYSDLDDIIGNGLFDKGKFFNDFNKEMEQLDLEIQERMKHFPSQATSGLQGNQYKININLNGFEEKEITVKAKQGLMMLQGVHKTENGGERSYLDIRTLPSFVKAETGSWTYDEGVLKIVFGVQEHNFTTLITLASGTTEVVATQAPDREEIESHENDNTNQDADVGARGESEIINNKISNNTEEAVEATTYAFDVNDEWEFVPVKLKKVADNSQVKV